MAQKDRRIGMKVFFVFFLQLLVSSLAYAEVVEYDTAPAVDIDYKGGSVRYLDATLRLECSKQESAILDTSWPYFECQLKGKWFYAASPALRFAYDTTWTKLPSRWEYGGDSYHLVAKKNNKQYGEYYRVVSYEALSPGKFFITDFSFRHGVIGFYSFDEDSGKSNWYRLSSKYGLKRP